ncbi:MAG: glycosyltransferase, partial [Cyanobacteria bacterium J06648_11]
MRFAPLRLLSDRLSASHVLSTQERRAMKLMVYSHDTYGLGNLRRMLAICEHLSNTLPDLKILLISGAPMLHEFRLPEGLDYIKLPCLRRSESGDLSAKYLGTNPEETVRLRAALIRSATMYFRPDLLLVDKKPYGLKHELESTFAWMEAHLPQCRRVLLLRDILYNASDTIAEWQKQGYAEAIAAHYDRVEIVGSPRVFDARREYQMPRAVGEKVRYCGYICKPRSPRSVTSVRQELELAARDRLVLVTAGGGEDGFELMKTYLAGLAGGRKPDRIETLMVTGPDMPDAQREALAAIAAPLPNVTLHAFAADMAGYMQAADAVVAMGGYNTVTEILALGRPAAIVPRIRPVTEQWIRAERMERLKVLRAIHPDRLTPERLMDVLALQLDPTHCYRCRDGAIDLSG